MFDIGFLELLIVAVIALVVLGPERLPVAIKVTAIWIGRIKRSFQGIRSEIERELNVDEIRRDIHNAAVMEELEKTRSGLERNMNQVQETLNQPLSGLSAGKEPRAGSGQPAVDDQVEERAGGKS